MGPYRDEYCTGFELRGLRLRDKNDGFIPLKTLPCFWIFRIPKAHESHLYIFSIILFIGYCVTKPDVIFKLEQGEKLWSLEDKLLNQQEPGEWTLTERDLGLFDLRRTLLLVYFFNYWNSYWNIMHVSYNSLFKVQSSVTWHMHKFIQTSPQSIFITSERNLYLSVITLLTPSLSGPKQLLMSFCLYICLFWTFHINGII